jgi:hypothetical protein
MTTLAAGARDERRAGPDRRRRPTPWLSRYWLRGRRRGGRRTGETTRIYVDRYAPRELSLVVGVLALALADIALTGWHLSAGGSEVNPWLGELLERFGFAFMAAVKLAVTGAGLLLLLFHVRWPGVRAGLLGLLLLHGALLGWHTIVTADRLFA